MNKIKVNLTENAWNNLGQFKFNITPIRIVILHSVYDSLGAKTINVFRACLGAQLTICAQKWRNFVLFSTVSLRLFWVEFVFFFIVLALDRLATASDRTASKQNGREDGQRKFSDGLHLFPTDLVSVSL